MTDVSTQADLNAAIDAADMATTGSFVINLTGDILETSPLDAINLHAGVTLTISGQGHTLDGAGAYRGFFVYAGALTIEYLAIRNTVARGGNGGIEGAGGGAGLGGGLFIAGTNAGLASGASVTLNQVTFTSDNATGGNGGGGISGGGGGGGGLGGNGGNYDLGGGGGGGIGADATYGAGTAGVVVGAAPGGPGAFTAGPGLQNGGGPTGGAGGSGFSGFFNAGGGGGVGGNPGTNASGGNGGFGGGGGGGLTGGNGGFGGGGGSNGGNGGFGGGGSDSGLGGFGGGDGAKPLPFAYEGGGGLGAGGAIFVQQGGSLTISGGDVLGNTAQGGAGGNVSGVSTPASANGSAFGSAIFLQGDQVLVFNEAAGTGTTITDVIADQTGSGGTGSNAGAGSIRLSGSGFLKLAGTNTYSGGTTVASGTLALPGLASAGTGNITFLNRGMSEIELQASPQSDGALLYNPVFGFGVGDTISILSMAYSANATAALSGQKLVISSGGKTGYILLPDATAGAQFQVSPAVGAYGGIAVTVRSGNPVDAMDDTYAVAENASTFFAGGKTLLANDSAPDGGLTVVAAGIRTISSFTTITTENGQAIVNSDGSFTYTPNFGFTGTDRFTYRARDADGSNDDATATINVGISPPTPFDAVDDTYTTGAGTLLNVFGPGGGGLLSNDSAPGNLIVVQPGEVVTAQGVRINLFGNGSFFYTPPLGFSGQDTFTYTATGPGGRSDTAIVTITVLPDGYAKDDAYTTPAGTLLTIFAPGGGGLLSNDVSGGFPIAVVEGTVASTAGGSATLYRDGTFAYTPPAGFTGNDVFTYTATRADGSADIATVTVTVTAPPPNNPVDAVDDRYIVAQNAPATVFTGAQGVLANDTGADGGLEVLGFVGADPIPRTTAFTPRGGMAAIDATGRLTYQPATGFTGIDRLTYVLRDANGSTDQATITFTVVAPPDNPVDAVDDRYIVAQNAPATVFTGAQGVLANDTGADGGLEVLGFVGADPIPRTTTFTPGGGMAAIDANGRLTYQPATGFTGIDRLTYVLRDSNGSTAQATITFTVVAPPDNPVDAVDDSYIVAQNAPATVFTGTQGVLANDTGADGGLEVLGFVGADPIPRTTTFTPGGSMAAIDATGRLTYQPATGFTGIDRLTYVLRDANGSTDQATIILTVVAPNNPVDAVDDSYRTTRGVPLSVAAATGLLANDSAPDGGTAAGAGSFSTMQGGQVTVQANGAFTYTPPSAFTGADSFTYRLTDIDGSADTATATITVAAPPPPTPIPPVLLSNVALGIGGRRVRGEAPFDRAGSSVAGVGDLDGDGRGDLLIGAPYTQFENGAAYLLFSGAGITDLNVFSRPAGTAGGFRINGEGPVDHAGTSVAAAGDVNGDGIPDLLIGAPTNDANTATPFFDGAGAAYVVFGKPAAGDVNLAAVAGGSGGFKIIGEAAGDQTGYSVAGAGDVNGDGLADIIVGARLHSVGSSDLAGTAYVVFGKPGTTTVRLADVAAGAGGFAINGEGSGGQAGSAVSSAGDMNGDGLSDLLITTGGTDSAAGGRSAYVVFGKAGGAPVNLGNVAAGTGGFKIIRAGEPPLAIAGAGDVNGDGRPDLIIGDQSASPGSTLGAGVATVVFGKADTATVDISPGTIFAGFRIIGTGFQDGLGAAVSAAGDLNGDGLADLLIGAPGAVGNAAYAVFGKAGGADVNLADVAAGIGGFKIAAERNDDQLGISVSAAGDTNGDGLNDLLVGSWANIDFQTQVGATYLIYGSPAW